MTAKPTSTPPDSDPAPTPQDMLQLNRPRSIVPPMQNRVGDTYAETRAEREAKERADQEAEMALFRAREAAAEKPKKATVWLGILSIIFLVIALVGAGFGVFLYTQNVNLQEDYQDLQEKYNAAILRVSELEDAYATAQERLNAFLNKQAEEPQTQEIEQNQ